MAPGSAFLSLFLKADLLTRRFCSTPFVAGLLAVLFIPSAQANLCEAQTQALVSRVQAEVQPSLAQTQLDQLAVVARQLCESHVDSTRAAGIEDMGPPPEGFADWFSYFMLTKQPEKAGNKRLKRLK